MTRGRVVDDRRSRHCPYLDTINRWYGLRCGQRDAGHCCSSATLITQTLHPCHVSSPGVFWTLTLRSFAPSRCLTSTSTPALYAANTFKVGPPRGGGKETVVVLVVILGVFACRSRTEIPRLHSQRAVHPPRLPQSTHAQVLLSARQLWDHWLFARRHYSKLKWRVPELYHWYVKLSPSAGVRTFWKPCNQILNNILSHRKMIS